jgi:hypothetical protein
MLGTDCDAVGRGRPEEETSDAGYYMEKDMVITQALLGRRSGVQSEEVDTSWRWMESADGKPMFAI